jgi:hypothetical protein
MNILIGCEESQIVLKEFLKKGHNVYSCDLKSCTGGLPDRHFKRSIFEIISDEWQESNIKWDMIIFHFPCTYLTVTANKWLKDQPKRKSGKLVGEARRQAQKDAIDFFMKIWNCNIPKKCGENPVGVLNSIIPPSQIIQHYYFGDSEKKLTCLWLQNLSPLVWSDMDNLFGSKTSVDKPDTSFTSKFAGSSINAATFRSKTFPGIAKAMAEQWG